MKKIRHWTSMSAFLLFSTVMITIVLTLASDMVNDSSYRPTHNHDLFPKVVELLTFKKISFDFAGIDVPR